MGRGRGGVTADVERGSSITPSQPSPIEGEELQGSRPGDAGATQRWAPSTITSSRYGPPPRAGEEPSRVDRVVLDGRGARLNEVKSFRRVLAHQLIDDVARGLAVLVGARQRDAQQ